MVVTVVYFVLVQDSLDMLARLFAADTSRCTFEGASRECLLCDQLGLFFASYST